MVQIHVNLLLLVILHFYWLWNNMDAVSCFRHIILVKHIAKRYDELLSISIFASIVATVALKKQWRYNEADGVLNHQPCDCSLNRLFRCRWQKTSKLRVTGLCVENLPVTGEFPAQMASNTENVFIWWRHNEAKRRASKQISCHTLCGSLTYSRSITLPGPLFTKR